MKLIESRQNKIARRVTASAIYDKTRYAMEQLEGSMNKFIGNLDNSVPDTIRSDAGVMKSYVDRIRGNFDKDNFQECIDDLARLRSLSQEYSKKLMKWINQTFPEYKRDEMRDKYDWWYIDGTHFEECLKQEIEWQKKDNWKLTRNQAGALDESVDALQSLMSSWQVGESRVVSLSRYGYPDGWIMSASTWRSGDGIDIQVDARTENTKTRSSGGAATFKKSKPPDIARIRNLAKWMLDMIEK